MKTVEISTASKSLSDYAKQLDNEIILLTSHKKPIAAIVSLKNADAESLSLSSHPEFMKIIQKSRKNFKTGKKLTLREMKREVLSMKD